MTKEGKENAMQNTKNRKNCALDTLYLMRRNVCEAPIITLNSLNMKCSSLKVVIYVQISEIYIKGSVPSYEKENVSQNSFEKNSEIDKDKEIRHLAITFHKPLGK